jgi:hypothetical protein
MKGVGPRLPVYVLRWKYLSTLRVGTSVISLRLAYRRKTTDYNQKPPQSHREERKDKYKHSGLLSPRRQCLGGKSAVLLSTLNS